VVGGKRLLRRFFIIVTVVTVSAVGLAGAYQYGWTFWRYRGFPAPSVSAGVPQGRVVSFMLRSPALAGNSEPVYVFLPPGYSKKKQKRYPALYLLHGTPGWPEDFLEIGDMGVREDTLVAKHEMQPMLLVMPRGAYSPFGDTEWANGVRRGNGWETWVSVDVVNAIDHRFRVSANADARGIAGLSEGGYAALNIGIHHISEFHLLESWSGYMKADDIRAVFGRQPAAELRYNSPAFTIRGVAGQMKRDGDFIWFYCGSHDYSISQNVQFAAELKRLGVAHKFMILPGQHNWALWRSMANEALLVASAHLRVKPNNNGGGVVPRRKAHARAKGPHVSKHP
jgi:enterochelin esterase-like enzyme